MKKNIKIILLVILLSNTKIIKAAQYIWPIDSKNSAETYIEYPYGDRTYDWQAYDKKYNYAPFEAKYSNFEPHFGVDITGTKGSKYDVVSVSDGHVLTTSLDQLFNPGLNYIDRYQRRTTNDGGGYGNYIVIQEDNTGKCFLYAHLKAGTVTLRNGDKVSAGQKIGVMGSSGDAGHMHLHFEVRPSAVEVLPEFLFGRHKNLVVTYTYGVQTLNPIEFIGTNEEHKKQIEESQKEENKETIISIEEKESPATISRISYEKKYNYGQINIEFDKPVKIITTPTLEIKIGNEIKYAKYNNNINNKVYSYIFNYDDFDITTYGTIFVTIKDGQIVNSSDQSILANYIFTNEQIGYMNAYIISNTYEESLYLKQGDLNKDGMIDGSDATLTLRLYSKILNKEQLTDEENDQMTRADMNNDGIVDMTDAQKILRYYAEQSSGLTPTKQEQIINCDFNKDHKVSISDYEILESAINNNYQEKYDLNKDKKLNNEDIYYFKNILKTYGQR